MGQWTYLVIDIGTLLVPFIFSFHPRLRFHREWYRLWPAMLVVAAVFIAWDAVFARMGVWGFDARYITGVWVLGLPLEEVLFFICIPYACMFTYHAFGTVKPDPWHPRASSALAVVLGAGLLITGLLNIDRWYTGVTFPLLGVLLLWSGLVTRPAWMGRSLLTYAVLLLPFFVV